MPRPRSTRTTAGPSPIGGGVTPDVTIAATDDPWLTFVIQRGYLTSYAEAYLTTHSNP